MQISKVKNYFKEDWLDFETLLTKSLETDTIFLNTINKYLLDNSGKQLRPLLSILAAHTCGKSNSTSIAVAVISELIHTATLLHDDVADNSNLRRGVPTVRALFTPAASVLTGDYWLSKSLSLLTTQCSKDIVSCFTTAVENLSQGELIQMEKAEDLSTTEADYYNIIAKKTASLFIASVKGAAYAVTSEKSKLEAMERYAYHLGVAFQIRDDIFDYSPEIKSGKISGTDIREHKITLPLLGAFKAASADEVALIKKGILEVTPEGGSAEFVYKFVAQYNGVEYAQKALDNHCNEAIGALSLFDDSQAKEYLIQLANFTGTRER